MKYIVLLCDGMADYPVKELDGKTPMEAASKPHMDALAKSAEAGLVRTVAAGLKPGSDVANLSVMGYDPKLCYTGRSPLEAASIGIDLKETDVALRCNLVTLSEEEPYEQKTMVDYCAGDISSEEAAALIKTIGEALGDGRYAFYSGVSYRHCLVIHDGVTELGTLTPPHDISGRVIGEYLSSHPSAAPLIDKMKQSYEILKNHPVNLARIERGLRPANSIWLWGEGRRPLLEKFSEKYGITGGVVSAVDLIKGIGICAGMRVAEVEGATGYIDTNFEGKAAAAAALLEDGCDLVYVHVEAPDECGHRGETENKVKSIELIDQRVLAPLLKTMERYDDYRLLILPDHPTPLSTRTHAGNPVPYLLYQKSRPAAGTDRFCEKSAAATGVFIEFGPSLMDRLIHG